MKTQGLEKGEKVGYNEGRYDNILSSNTPITNLAYLGGVTTYRMKHTIRSTCKNARRRKNTKKRRKKGGTKMASVRSEIQSKILNHIKPRTRNQRTYVEEINSSENPVVFGIGPAGTGKTMLAVYEAAKMLRNGQIKHIVLTRPAVESGEELGSLPGDMIEKTQPFLIPLLDYLNRFLGKEAVKKYMEKDIVEIAPIAYMRGRTFDNTFVIIDEAQNLDQMQLKMALTRIGGNSKMIINGDASQSDLKFGTPALRTANMILSAVPGIRFVQFTSEDVQRSGIVKGIVKAYEQHAERLRAKEEPVEDGRVSEQEVRTPERSGGYRNSASVNGHRDDGGIKDGASPLLLEFT